METPQPPDVDYWRKSLDLVADTLMTDVSETSDEKLAEKRDKLGAIVRMAVHWWRVTTGGPSAAEGQGAWPDCTAPAFCSSGNFGGRLVCQDHFAITNGAAVPAPPDVQALIERLRFEAERLVFDGTKALPCRTCDSPGSGLGVHDLHLLLTDAVAALVASSGSRQP